MSHLVASADPECLEQLHLLLERFWLTVDVPGAERDRFTLALAELVGNLVVHGRRVDGTPATLELRLAGSPTELRAVLEDDGAPVPDPGRRELPDESAVSGRGLAMAYAVLDELAYERRAGRNRWRLVLLRAADAGDGGAA
ncbi:MAG: putative anti-sigma regulatory factor, serine/threonine protein kinase [Solirubrobacterales bacterium]|nr:putative anti-sigma regulatory factor, serine/threonine protein kinase [Solirubrobacterales bacterium]